MRSESRSLESISVLLFVVAANISALLTIFSDNFVPEQFTRDSKYIQSRMESSVTGYDDSFQFMVDFYTNFGISKPNSFLRLAEWLIFFSVLMFARSFYKEHKKNFKLTLIGVFYLLLIPFYGSLFTKEIFMSILLGCFLLARKYSKKHDFLAYLVLIVFFAITIRNYYFLTLIFFLLYSTKDSRWKKSFWDFLLPIILLSVTSTIENATSISSKLTGSNIFAIRLETQSGFRLQVNSLIHQDPLGTSILGNFWNYSKVAFDFLFPWRILEPNVYSLVVFLIVITLVAITVYPYLSRIRSSSFDAIFLWSYFSVGLIFEPDLGSFVRHTFPFLPIALLANGLRIEQKNQLGKFHTPRGTHLETT
jgi:hypothetical protein